MSSLIVVVGGVSVGCLSACGSPGDVHDSGSGGTAADSGGVPAAGGSSVGDGGTPATGGASAGDGGSLATGGDPSAAVGGTASGSGGVAGTGGANGSGGAPGGDDCTTNAEGQLVAGDDELVFDERSCLYWQRQHADYASYVAAEAYCEGLELGGYSDFRLPTAGEAASMLDDCGVWPAVPEGIFTADTDFWTSTSSGENHVCGAIPAAKVFSTLEKITDHQIRCVRGPSVVPDRPDCGTQLQMCP